MESTDADLTNPNPTAQIDLVAADFRGMRLRDTPSPREQPMPVPPPVPVPTMPAAALMRQLQLQSQVRLPQNFDVGESSAGYVPPYASCSNAGFFDSHFGKHSPRLNAASAAPTPPVTPELDAGAGHFYPVAPSFPSESRSSSPPSPRPSLSHYHHPQLVPSAPQLGAAAWDRNSSPLNPSAFAFQSSAWDRDSSLNPYASAFQSSAWDRYSSLNPYASTVQSFAWGRHSSLNPYASASQSTLSASPMNYRPWIPSPVRSYLTLEQVRSRLRRRPMEPDLLMSPEIAAHVVSLLVEGDERVRRSVLAGVRLDARGLMRSNDRLGVLLALVRACAGRPDELHDIVLALDKSNGYLMSVAKNHNGMEIRVEILKELIGAVAPHPQLLGVVMCWLLREGLMEQPKGAELLQHCFTILSYDDSKIIIHFAIHNINELVFSSHGSRCLAECLAYARNDELHALVDIILSRTVEIAMGQYSNYFLQRAIDLGSEPLQVAIADRVAADVVNLSSDRFGSFVVEACFLRARSRAPLQRLLAAFLQLRGDELAEMVRGNSSNYVVSKLLENAMIVFPEPARALARKIEKLPAAVQREMHARSVMKNVSKLTRGRHAY